MNGWLYWRQGGREYYTPVNSVSAFDSLHLSQEQVLDRDDIPKLKLIKEAGSRYLQAALATSDIVVAHVTTKEPPERV